MKILHIFEQKYLIDDNLANVHEVIKRVYGIDPKDYFISENDFSYRVYFRLRGGKGGFGRSIKQDGERRSRRLPPNKDSCRTLSGKRIGFLKAKRRTIELTEKINQMKKKREEMKAIRKRTNIQKDLEEIEMKQKEMNETIQETINFAEKRKEEMKKEENEITNPHVDMLDFSMLMNSDNE